MARRPRLPLGRESISLRPRRTRRPHRQRDQKRGGGRAPSGLSRQRLHRRDERRSYTTSWDLTRREDMWSCGATALSVESRCPNCGGREWVVAGAAEDGTSASPAGWYETPDGMANAIGTGRFARTSSAIHRDGTRAILPPLRCCIRPDGTGTRNGAGSGIGDGALWTHQYGDPHGREVENPHSARHWYTQGWVQALGGIGVLVVAAIAMTVI